jgi:hypothetical protein
MALDGLEVIAHARAPIPENPLVGVTTMAAGATCSREWPSMAVPVYQEEYAALLCRSNWMT